MATGDIWEFIVKGGILGQEMVNVFHYKAVDAVSMVFEDMADAFEDTVLLVCTNVMSADTGFSSLEIKQVTGGGAYFTRLYSPILYGEVAGETLPPSACWTFRLQRAQLGRRHGYKRLGGVNESSQAGGVAVSGLLPGLAIVAAAIGSDLTPVTGPVLRPIILHRMLNGQPVTPPVAQDIATVVYSHIGTQNSRKFGHGR